MGGGDNAADATGSSGSGGKVVYAEFFAPAAAWAPESDDAQVLSRAGCLETLLRYEADGSLGQNLATSWEQVEPTVWSFHLREGVEFQNGEPMDADAVTQALEHVLDAKTPARSFNSDVVSGVKAVDATTVQITTPSPDVLLPLRMSSPNTGILAPEAFEGDQINIEGTCTGPFTVVKQTPGQSLDLERNDGYWGGKPKVATAEVRFVADGAARVTQVQTGEADISSVIPAVSLSTLQGDGNVDLETLQSPRTAAMLLNNSRPPFDDPLVRKAIQHAVDTEAIAATVYEGGATPAAGPFSPEDPWAAEGATPVSYDPDEAKRLLDQAGVDPSSLGFELVAYNDRPEFADLAAVIQDQLGQLGIKVKIRAGDYASVEPALLAGDFDAALFSRGYLVDVADPAGYLVSDWSCKGTFNIAHYCDPQTDAMIDQALKTEDGDARHEIEAQIGQKLQDDPASVFLVHESLVTAVRSDVHGFEPHPLNFYVLTADLSVDG
jgi:peptide/nickel transport system substrate-binding protein